MSVSFDADFVAKYPIGDHLELFRRRVETACKASGVNEVRNITQFSETLPHELISALMSLISALMSLISNHRSLLLELHDLSSRILSQSISNESIGLLVDKVCSQAPDLEIWNAILPLHNKSTTPPPRSPSFTASVQQTPWSYTSASAVDTSDYRRVIDGLLNDELTGKLIIDHPKFYDAFFKQSTHLSDTAAAVFEMCKTAEPSLYKKDVGWAGWPDQCEERKVLDWFQRRIEDLLSFAKQQILCPSTHRRCVANPNKPVSGSVSKRKLDIALIHDSRNERDNKSDGDYNWSHILVPGELKSNLQEDGRKETWLDLSRYVREIFSAQDTRRFVLGFTLCGPKMRLWEFDRLGGIASESFDIHQDGEMFVAAVLGFLWMNEEELGFDPTIKEEEGRRFTEIRRDDRLERLYLKKLLKRQRCVAGRATTCWEGSLGDDDSNERPIVIKDSWEYDERPEEGSLLKEATELRVKNLARYYHHETVHVRDVVDDVRNNVRKNLSEIEGKVRNKQEPQQFENTTVSSASESSRRDEGRSGSRKVTRKRSSNSMQLSMPPSKRSNSESPVKQDTQKGCNRTHRRLVMRDVGKNFYDATCPQAVLTGLLGGIKGHESLLEAGFLHRDVSLGNIMLNVPEDDGFLIDLDLAIKINRDKPSGAPSKTGTKVFMGIGPLFGEEHKAKDDLESFFWSLFWLGVHWNGPGQGTKNKDYDLWNNKNTKELGQIKLGLITEEGNFDNEVKQSFTAFSQPLVPCIQALRKAVFPDGRRRKGEDREMYSRMKLALEKARKELDVA